MRALVVGGGIGGIAAAAALTRRGIEVRVYEQAARLAEVGAGVGITPNGLRVLDRLGLSAVMPDMSAARPAGQPGNVGAWR
jgi:salicylate hydroxylase